MHKVSVIKIDMKYSGYSYEVLRREIHKVYLILKLATKILKLSVTTLNQYIEVKLPPNSYIC